MSSKSTDEDTNNNDRPSAPVNNIEVFELMTKDLYSPNKNAIKRYFQKKRWSYGDVENNGVYYHPNLTHYAHQVFEEFVEDKAKINYVDISRVSKRSEKIRKELKIRRMTFPVQWVYQFMRIPMEAGDYFRVGIDTVDIDPDRIGVRAWILDSKDDVAGIVIWVRWAVYLPEREIVSIPDWFPRLPARMGHLN